MRAILPSAIRAFALSLLAGAALAGCGDDGGSGTPDAGPDADPTPKCFENPRTHEELINACTTPDVEKIDKRPVLPLLGPDGMLPPIP